MELNYGDHSYAKLTESKQESGSGPDPLADIRERFSDRARKVLQLANGEAQRLCHETLGTHHLLLGLWKEADGVAGQCLAELRISLGNVRLAVAEMFPTLGDVIIMGKLPMEKDCEQVLRNAVQIDDNKKKPVVCFIAGVTAPPGKRMGHAGALISGGADTAQAKLDIMEECGIKATKNPSEMARLLQAML